MWRSGCRTTAAATTGPARQPRPTSSQPATCTNPTRRSAFSSVRVAGTLDTSDLRLRGVLHPRRLALQIAQVVQLGAADLGRARDFDLGNGRRVERKDALDSLAERHLAHGEGRARAAAVHADDHTLEHLDALLVAFAHLDVHLDRVAGLHRRPLGQLRLFDQLNRAHHSLLLSLAATALLRRPNSPRRADPAAAPASGSAPRACAIS